MSVTDRSQPKIHITFNRAKDRYCFYCDDSGRIIDCSLCHRGFCYDVMGEDQDELTETEVCITIPAAMVNDRRSIFRCPECLSHDIQAAPDYIINRGSRMTRRLSVKSSLVLVVFHLSAQQTLAEALVAQLCAALSVFEINIVTYKRTIGDEVQSSEADAIHRQLLPDAPYHLALIFLTESDPRGGWWISTEKDKGGASRTSENKFIRYHVKALTQLAKDAVTARMFMISCAVNLFRDSALGKIFDTLNCRPWHSIVIPTVPAVLPPDIVCILPELFVHLYYFLAALKGSLLRTWAKSPEARAHTGFIVMDRASWLNEPLNVFKLEHAPHTSRPYGFDLPMVPSICGCWDKAGRWGSKWTASAFNEHFAFYRSSCCAFELHIAIFIDRRFLLHAHGTTIMQEPWDRNTKSFTFDESRMVRIEYSPARRGGAEKISRPSHDSPWTIAGQQAQGSPHTGH